MSTQREIARRLSLSPSTVSKAFRNCTDICPQTRDLITKEAEKIGYVAPVSPKVDDQQSNGEVKSRFIGVFYCDDGESPTEPKNIMYLDGLSSAATRLNASLIVHRVENSRDLLDPQLQPPALKNGLLEGLILIYKFEEEVVRKLAQMLPIVTITHWVAGAHCDHIDSDHIGGMQTLVRHLKSLGHTKMGFAGMAPGKGYDKSRASSFIRALLNEGLEVMPEVIDLLRTERPERQDCRKMAELIAGNPQRGITAWLCSSDWAAFHIVANLEEMGIRVPEDISVAGFDKINSLRKDANKLRELTTVATPFTGMGRTALERLDYRIAHPGCEPVQILLNCEFCAGTTAGQMAQKS